MFSNVVGRRISSFYFSFSLLPFLFYTAPVCLARYSNVLEITFASSFSSHFFILGARARTLFVPLLVSRHSACFLWRVLKFVETRRADEMERIKCPMVCSQNLICGRDETSKRAEKTIAIQQAVGATRPREFHEPGPETPWK